MALITRIGTAMILLAAVLPLAAATSTGSRGCNEDEFWYDKKNCCLPKGGPPSPSSPPKDTDCPPTGYYWGEDKGCCLPRNSPPSQGPEPQCRKGWEWYNSVQKCLPRPTSPSPPPSHPSGSPGNSYGHGKDHEDNDDNDDNEGEKGNNRKRSLPHKSRFVPLCPSGLDACPIAGSGDYECLDTTTELESCGGCISFGGHDCTAILGAWNVGCERGRCAVYTCAGGFKRSPDGTSCIAL